MGTGDSTMGGICFSSRLTGSSVLVANTGLEQVVVDGFFHAICSRAKCVGPVLYDLYNDQDNKNNKNKMTTRTTQCFQTKAWNSFSEFSQPQHWHKNFHSLSLWVGK